MQHKRYGRAGMFLGLAGLLFVGGDTAAADQKRVIIKSAKPYDKVIAAVRGLGGEVEYQFENVDAIAASVPEDRLAEVSALAGVQSVVKDAIVNTPRPIESVGGSAEKGLSVEAMEAEEVQVLDEQDLDSLLAELPANYNFNNSLTGAAGLHAQGKLGQGVIVAVIDTGTANSPVVPALSGTVIGGENFVTADPIQSATSRQNDPHGTWVGSMIASHANFIFVNTSALVRSLRIHAPSSVISCPGPPFVSPCLATRSIIPMIGTAPASKIYALKVFDSRGGGAPESRIIAAMDRAITLRRNFNNGMPSVPVSGNGLEDDPFRFNSLKIEIVNMSLGGPTLFAGRDLEDQLTLQMLQEGITIVASAGNDGFAAMTGGSPGTGIGTLTAGAASTSVHERVLRDVQCLGGVTFGPACPAAFGVGFGSLFRPTSHHQTAFFSSRGPTADGRVDPDVTANGFASFAQGSRGTINLVSGTSFSSPTTAGAAALLRRESASATAAQIRNSLIESANPSVLGDGSGPIDQGSGFIHVPGALGLLNAGGVTSDVLPTRDPNGGVRQNAARLGFRTVNFNDDRFATRVENLRPGEVAQFFVRSREDTDRLLVSLRNITPELPPAQQNPLFGDDIFLNIVDAPTSFARTRVEDFVFTDRTFTINNPQSGLVRVALQGDWTNAGRISADLEIVQERHSLTAQTANGQVSQGDFVPVQVDVPAGTAQVVFELFWQEDWASYPTNDIDLILRRPNGTFSFAGATLDSPERVVINNPAAGTWTAFINGFTVHGKKDHFVFRATADGERLRSR